MGRRFNRSLVGGRRYHVIVNRSCVVGKVRVVGN